MSPVFGYFSPFLERKGDGGMVETAAERRRSRTGAAVSARPAACFRFRPALCQRVARYDGDGQEGQVVAPIRSGRKVRTPSGEVLGNAQAS